MTEVISEKGEIDRIIKEQISGRRIVFTAHYRVSSAEKGISDEKVMEVFSQFDKVYAIEKEVLRYGDIGYELFYKLSNNTDFSIATCPSKDKLLIIHAVEYKRSLRKRFRTSG